MGVPQAWNVISGFPIRSARSPQSDDTALGRCGRPSKLENSRSSGASLPSPSIICISRSCLRCSRRASIATFGKVILRRPAVVLADLKRTPRTVRRQRSLDRTDGLNKGEFLAHRNVHRSEDETANPTIEGTG